MGFASKHALVEHEGIAYQIDLESDIENFEATRNGGAVTDSELLAVLYGTSQALGFIERMLRAGGAQEHITKVVDPSRTLLQQVVNIHALEFARDALGHVAGAAVAAYAAGIGGFVSPWTTFRSAIAEEISKAGLTVLNIGANLFDFWVSGTVIETGADILSLGISTAETLIADVNAGRTIKSSDVKLAADATIDGYQIVNNITDYMVSSGALDGNAWTDAAELIASAGTTFLGVLGFTRGVTPVEKTILGYVSFVGEFRSLAELIDKGARAHTEFASNASTGSPYYSNINIGEYENFFETASQVQIAPNTTDVVEVTTGYSEHIISDARIYISEMVFLEGYSGQQGFVIQLSESLPYSVTFRYSIYDLSGPGKATEGSDFTGITGGTFVVPAGTNQTVLPVSILDDSIAESISETVYLAIYDPTGATLDNGKLNDVVKGYIVDDDFNLTSSDTRTIAQVLEDNNNTPSGEAVVNDTNGGSNLVAASFGVDTTSASPGSTVVVTYTIMNTGDESSGRGRVEIVSARSSDLLSNRSVGETFEFPTLDPGESRTYTKEIDLSNYSDGDTYLGIEVSSISLGHDVVGSDNTVSVPFHIEYGISGNPDLRPTNLSDLEGQVFQPGQVFNFTYQITTNGEGAPPYSYRILYSTDENVSKEDVTLFSETTNQGLGYLGVHYYSELLTVPIGARDGVGYVLVDVDPGDAITERREDNNVRKETIVVSSELADADNLPNIVAEVVTVEAPSLTAGQAYNFKMFGYLGSPDDGLFDPNNQSGENLTVHLFLSEDPVFDESDFSFFNTVDYVDLTIGTQIGASSTFTVPSYMNSGEYFVFAVWDYNDEITEDNEYDNVSSPLRVNITNPNSREVVAQSDYIEIIAGQQAIANIISNDTSVLDQDLKVLRFANNSSIAPHGYSFSDASGVDIHVASDGIITIDTSGFNVNLEPGSVHTLGFQYLVKGLTDLNYDLGEVRIVVQDPRPAPDVPIVFLGTSDEDVFVAGEQSDKLFGNGGDDTLSGGGENDLIVGGPGSDDMTGGTGNDDYSVDDAGDVVNELPLGGDDKVYTSVTYDVPDNVEVLIMGGSDNLNSNGTSARDYIFGNTGENIINGAGGFDVMQGGAGNDTYAVDNSYDAVIEMAGASEGYDTVYTSVDLILAGNVETLILTGTAVQGFGDSTDNQIFGNGNVNVLFGQGGDDYLLGLGGDDIFVITPEAGAFDVIGDFEGAGAVGGDRIAVAGFGAGAQIYQVSQASFEIRSGDNSIIQQFVLQGHDGTALDAGDYYFA